MKSIILYHRFKNWALEHKEWIICIGGVALLFILAFQAGYILGRHELSPIIIEKVAEWYAQFDIIYVMDSRQKIIIGISVLVVFFLVFAGIMKKKNKDVLEENAGEEESGEITESESVFTPVVPEKVELTIPMQASPVREGASEKLGIFNLEMTKAGFAPRTIAATKGDVVQILLKAVDDDYDFAIPYVGIYKFVEKGSEGMLSFQATDAGTLAFQCRDACPKNGGEGKIVVIP